MMMSVGQLVEYLAGETEVLGENLSYCLFVYHKPRITWPGLEPWTQGTTQATNRLSYGTALASLQSKIILIVLTTIPF
jgi:hypothetical protein